MIRQFPVTFSTSFMEFGKNACITLPAKKCRELLDTFQFLLIWQDYFQSNHGELKALSHLSNPDDPPDVIAHFADRSVAIEITTIDPSHMRQSDDLHDKVGQGSGRTEIPLSIKPRNRQEALDMMYVPGLSPWEDVDDRNQVWFNSIYERVAKKLSSPRIRAISPGIILMPGQIEGSYGEAHAVAQAFAAIRASMPAYNGWTIAICHQWNHLHYFSAIDAPGLGFEIKEKHS